MWCNLPRYLLSTFLPEGRMEKVRERAEEMGGPGVSGGLQNGGGLDCVAREVNEQSWSCGEGEMWGV